MTLKGNRSQGVGCAHAIILCKGPASMCCCTSHRRAAPASAEMPRAGIAGSRPLPSPPISTSSPPASLLATITPLAPAACAFITYGGSGGGNLICPPTPHSRPTSKVHRQWRQQLAGLWRWDSPSARRSNRPVPAEQTCPAARRLPAPMSPRHRPPMAAAAAPRSTHPAAPPAPESLQVADRAAGA